MTSEMGRRIELGNGGGRGSDARWRSSEHGGRSASTLAVLWSVRRHDGDGLGAGDRLNRRGGSRLCFGVGAENWRWRQWIGKRDGGRGGCKVAAVVELEQGAGLGEDGAEKGEQGRLDGDGEMVVTA